NRSLRFLDAYRGGLNGKWTAYVTKQYRGHRVLPQTCSTVCVQRAIHLIDSSFLSFLCFSCYVLSPGSL
ncbi:hypothetical protein B0H14DRAFT_2414203, partial [Mycena olivaceomarginata]